MRIQTPRGLTLAGTFVNPVDSTDAAILFSHSFLANRHSGDHFDRLARVYRSAGYATLEFDYSGHGESADDIITTEHQVEDLRSASGWLADQGFTRQLVHGHSFGAVSAMIASPPAVQTMVLSGAITGPLSFDWESIFSEVQLDDLEQHGVTTIPDDTPGPRRNFTISKQTLVDLSMVDSNAIFSALKHPVLLIHDRDDEQVGLVEMTQANFPRFPKGTQVEVVRGARFAVGQNPRALSDASLAWAKLRVPLIP